MQKLIVALLFLSFSGQLFARNGHIFYRESAEVFEIMDNLSGWHPGHDPAYIRHWRTALSRGNRDEGLFQVWRNLRKKYAPQIPFDQKEEQSHLFMPRGIPVDFFADIFYRAKSVDHALTELNKKLKPGDTKKLAEVLKALKPEVSKWVAESSLFNQTSTFLDKKFKKEKFPDVLKKAKRFLEAPKWYKNPQILLVWYPIDKDPVVAPMTPYVMVRSHPSKVDQISTEMIAKAVVESLFQSWPKSTKITLSNKFLSTCPKARVIAPADVIQRPLINILAKFAQEKKVERRDFRLNFKDLNPWVNHYAKALFPIVEQAMKRRETISGPFWNDAYTTCQEISELSAYLNAFSQ